MTNPTEPLNPATLYGQEIADALNDAVDRYQQIADKLCALAEGTPKIGQKQGRGTVTATEFAAEAAAITQRWTPSLARVIRAAANYERHVPQDGAE